MSTGGPQVPAPRVSVKPTLIQLNNMVKSLQKNEKQSQGSPSSLDQIKKKLQTLKSTSTGQTQIQKIRQLQKAVQEYQQQQRSIKQQQPKASTSQDAAQQGDTSLFGTGGTGSPSGPSGPSGGQQGKPVQQVNLGDFLNKYYLVYDQVVAQTARRALQQKLRQLATAKAKKEGKTEVNQAQIAPKVQQFKKFFHQRRVKQSPQQEGTVPKKYADYRITPDKLKKLVLFIRGLKGDSHCDPLSFDKDLNKFCLEGNSLYDVQNQIKRLAMKLTADKQRHSRTRFGQMANEKLTLSKQTRQKVLKTAGTVGSAFKQKAQALYNAGKKKVELAYDFLKENTQAITRALTAIPVGWSNTRTPKVIPDKANVARIAWTKPGGIFSWITTIELGYVFASSSNTTLNPPGFKVLFIQ
ncbi:MAG: hypothetical protein EB101_12105, partial [Chitinophagia bacterium]|nr:hypothetical protein [Chitinophagia bacterium]